MEQLVGHKSQRTQSHKPFFSFSSRFFYLCKVGDALKVLPDDTDDVAISADKSAAARDTFGGVARVASNAEDRVGLRAESAVGISFGIANLYLRSQSKRLTLHLRPTRVLRLVLCLAEAGTRCLG